MKSIWILFCTIIFLLGVLYILFYPIIYAVEHNAPECIFAQDEITCTQIKIK